MSARNRNPAKRRTRAAERRRSDAIRAAGKCAEKAVEALGPAGWSRRYMEAYKAAREELVPPDHRMFDHDALACDRIARRVAGVNR